MVKDVYDNPVRDAASGLANKIRGKLQNIQDERKARQLINERAQSENRRGYAEAARKREYDKGYQRGLGQQNNQAPQGGTSSGRRGGRYGGPDWKTGGSYFGGNNSFDMFSLNGGGSQEKPRPQMVRTRTISPDGKVTITEPYEGKQRPMQQADSSIDFWGMPGAAGVPRKKGERDPHDFILG